MADLSTEKDGRHLVAPVQPRSSIIKKFHTDAEEEFFLLSVLSAKIDLATKGCSNAAVSDIEPSELWNRAQEEGIAMHQFHDWIMSHMLSMFQRTQDYSTTISHTWKSHIPTEAADTVDDAHVAAEDKESTPVLLAVKPADTHKYLKRDSPKQLMEEEQILTDEESDIDLDDEEEMVYRPRKHNLP